MHVAVSICLNTRHRLNPPKLLLSPISVFSSRIYPLLKPGLMKSSCSYESVLFDGGCGGPNGEITPKLATCRLLISLRFHPFPKIVNIGDSPIHHQDFHDEKNRAVPD